VSRRSARSRRVRHGARAETSLPRAALIQAAGLDSGEAEAAIKAALRHDLIVEADGNFRLAVPLMRRWIQSQQAG
jgi:hypothetical protein